MSNSVPPELEGLPATDWKEHITLIVGALTATLICLKILAVASWDMVTAFGVLAESGTANVLTGTLLAVLPVLAVIALIILLYNMEAHLTSKNARVRLAAYLFMAVTLMMIQSIAPLAFLILVLTGWLVFRGVVWVRSRFRKQNKRTLDAGSTTGQSFLTWLTFSLVVLLVSSLSVPWLPPEVAEVEGTEVTVYVLNSNNERTSVLLENGRSIVRVDEERLSGEYCRHRLSWITESLPALLNRGDYPTCPANTLKRED
jgi:chromate transport protein ChrA